MKNSSMVVGAALGASVLLGSGSAGAVLTTPTFESGPAVVARAVSPTGIDASTVIFGRRGNHYSVLARKLSAWYLAVGENRRPAKFRIAATVATKLDPAASGEDALWAELDRLTPIFLARWEAIRAGQRLPPAAEGPSLLELCRELAYRMLGHCNFCPWDCRVDRVAGTRFGACKLAGVMEIRADP